MDSTTIKIQVAALITEVHALMHLYQAEPTTQNLKDLEAMTHKLAAAVVILKGFIRGTVLPVQLKDFKKEGPIDSN